MSAINLKSITGITSITTPAGVDNQLTLHNNNTSEAVKLDTAGNLHFHNHLNISGISTAANFKTGTSNLHSTGLNIFDLDVDGHTNLDNVSVAGIVTITNSASGIGLKLVDASNKQFMAGGGGGGTPFVGSFTGHDFRIQVGGIQNAIFKYASGAKGNLEIGPSSGIGITFNGSTGNAGYAGIITATGADINGDLDVDGHTNLDNVSIAGVTTASGNIIANDKIGIGINNPSQPLTILRSSAGQGEFGVRFQFTDTNGPTNTSSALLVGSYGLKLKNYNSNRNFLFETGNVGIGTNDPATNMNLHVLDQTDRCYVTLESGGNESCQLWLKNPARTWKISNYYDQNALTFTDDSDERLRIGSEGNLALGGTNTSAYANQSHFFIGGMGNLYADTPAGSGSSLSLSNNAYINTSGNWVYRTGGKSTNIYHYNGDIGFRLAGTGSAGNTISWSEALRINSSGRINIGNGNNGSPLGALHINTSSSVGTDTALFIGDNANKRFMVVNQVSNTEQFSEMKLQFNDNGTRSVLKLSNPYAPAGYGTAILFQGYNDGQQGMVYCQSEGANNANSTLSLSSTGAFLHGNSNKHVTMPHQPSFAAYQSQSDWTVSGTMVFNSTRHNVGNHYNTSNGHFTAPVAGSYQFNFYSIYRGNHTSAWVSMYKNNSRMIGGDIHFTTPSLGNNWHNVSFSQVIYLNVNDYIEMKSAQSTVWHGNNWQCFSGYLLG